MKVSKAFGVFSTLLLTLSHALPFCQDLSIKQIINGEGIQPYMKLASLPPDYKAVKIELTTGGSDGSMGGMMPLMMMGMSSGSGDQGSGPVMAAFMLSNMFSGYWTKAETVRMNGSEFLVAYRLEFGIRKDFGMVQGPPVAAALRLSLVRTDMIASLSPDPKASIADVAKMLDEAKIPYDVPVEMVNLPAESAATAAVLAPVFSQAKEAAKKTATLSNAKQLALGMIIYASDYDDVLPYVQSTASAKFVVQPYLKNDSLWKSLNPAGGEFKMNMAVAGVSMVDVNRPAEVVLFYEENPWENGNRCVAYLDGHAKTISDEEWQRARATLKLKFKKRAKPLPPSYGIGKS